MKNENENENETSRKNWTDERLINFIVGWCLEEEKMEIQLNSIEMDIEAVETTIYTSPNPIEQETNGKYNKLIPRDRLVDLMLHSIKLKEMAVILRVRIAHAKKNINFSREMIDEY